MRHPVPSDRLAVVTRALAELNTGLGSVVLFTPWPPAAAIVGLQPLHAADWLVGAPGGLLATAPGLLLRRSRK